ncbi:MAG: helix-turn-helix transcriptional regulator [Cyclobacteriaceae bacterium]
MDNPRLTDPSIPTTDSSSSPADLSMNEVLLSKLNEVVMANLQNEQFSVEDLASEAAFSRSHLHRKLNQLTGQSISQFIREIRLNEGMKLLKKEVGTVSEIAFKVGFGSNTYFIKCFHEHFGFSPGEVKKKVAEGWDDTHSQELKEPIDQQNAIVKPAAPLEALHPAASEQLIMEIFHEMVKYKPALERFLMVDEEEGESVDPRILAYQIIKNYPWPIGVEIRRLFSASLREPNHERHAQLQKAIGRTIRIISFLCIAEVCNLIHSQTISTCKNDKKPLVDGLQKLTNADLIGSLQIAAKYIKENSHLIFVKELDDLLDNAFFLELNDWSKLPDQEHEIASACMLLEQTLMMLLKKTAFLVGYKMVNVGSIKVKKARYQQASFHHEFHMLNSIDSEFRIHQEIMEQFSDSNAVILMKSIKDAQRFLNLSPMIIDTQREELQGSGKTQIKRDIFLLEAFDNGHLKYSGTGATSQDDLSSLDAYAELLEEYELLINLLKS